ncbi:hypothetical protein ACH50O_05020 [Methylomonas sp. 2BW1-5-20]|uniref:hypothetical protein n=1 Tax=Methylomonas sp. 2BW1-5-20 TaxID=3376686 RepID=UPI00404DF399
MFRFVVYLQPVILMLVFLCGIGVGRFGLLESLPKNGSDLDTESPERVTIGLGGAPTVSVRAGEQWLASLGADVAASKDLAEAETKSAEPTDMFESKESAIGSDLATNTLWTPLAQTDEGDAVVSLEAAGVSISAMQNPADNIFGMIIHAD